MVSVARTLPHVNGQEDCKLEKSLLADLPDVLTPAETAHVLRLGRNTTYELIRSGKLRHVKVGRRLLVPKSAVLQFLGDGVEGG